MAAKGVSAAVSRAAVSVVEALEQRQLLTTTPSQIAINFGPWGSESAGGYFTDSGEAYGTQQFGFDYGWQTAISSSNTFERSASKPQKYETGIITSTGNKWEMSIPNGTYRVRLVAGDANITSGTYKYNVESTTNFINASAGSGDARWVSATGDVTVNDGKLTIQDNGGTQHRLAFVDVVLKSNKNVGNVPGTPTGLTATARSRNQVDLRWIDNADNENFDGGYVIERQNGTSGAWTVIATVDGGIRQHSVDYQSVTTGAEYTYRVKAKGTDNSGAATESGYSTTAFVDLPLTDDQGAYGRSSGWDVAGTIEAEAYDRGLANDAYSDDTNANAGGFFRAGSIDTGARFTDQDLLYYVGWIESTEWQEYTVDVGAAGEYYVVAQVASPGQGGTWTIKIDGEDTELVNQVRDTGGFHLYDAQSTEAFSLDAGNQVFRFEATGEDATGKFVGNFNSFTFHRFDAPSVNTPTAPSSAQINVSWTSNHTGTGWNVLSRRKSGQSAWTHIATVPAATLSFADTDPSLEAGSTYEYRLQAQRRMLGAPTETYDFTPDSNIVSVALPANSGAPAAPISPAAASNGATVTVSWQDQSTNETGFEIQRAASSAFTSPTTLTSGVNTASKTETPAGGQTWWYRVRAVNGGQASAWTSGVSVYVSSSTTTDVTFAEDTFVRSGTNAGVNYGGDGALEVKYADSGSFAREAFIKLNLANLPAGDVDSAILWVYGSKNSTNDPSLQFEARSVASTSWTEGGMTYNNKPDIYAAGEIVLDSLVLPNDTSNHWYQLDLSSYVQSRLANNQTTIAVALSGVVSSSAFWSLVSSEGANTSQRPYLRVVTTSPEQPVPEAPTGLHRVVPDPDVAPVGIAWTDASTNETSFEVERRVGAGAWTTLQPPTAAGVETYSDTTCDPANDQSYRVRAVNSGVPSEPSNEIVIPARPAAPTAGSVTANSVPLTWNDVSSVDTGYHVERKAGSGSWERLTGTTPVQASGGTVAYADLTVSPWVSYQYRVRAITASAEGLPSAATSVTPGDSLTIGRSTASGGDFEGTAITLTATFPSGPAPEGTTYSWTITRDGLPFLTNVPSGTQNSYSLTPTDEGTYSATATASVGNSGSLNGLVVENADPIATISGAPTGSILEGTAVNLTAVANDAGTTDTLQYAWSVTQNGGVYMPGTATDQAAFGFTPRDNGSYIATVVVTDGDGGLVSVSTTAITVTNAAPTASIDGEPVTTTEGSTISVTSTVADPGVEDTQTYAWSVTKDGNAFGLPGSAVTNASTFNFVPIDNGSYVIHLTVTDDDAAPVSVMSETIVVTNLAPTLTLSGDDVAFVSQPYALGIAAFDPGTDTITSYLIDWGDNSDPDNDGNVGLVVSDVTDPILHIYTALGTFTIQVTPTDEDATHPPTTKGITVATEIVLPPAPPVAVWAGNETSDSAAIRWHSAETGLTGTQLQWSDAADFAGAATVSLLAGAESHMLAGLSSGQSYFVRVRSTNAGGSSDWSQPARFTTWPGVPDVPSNVEAEAMSANAIHITWSSAAGAASYLLQRSQDGGAWADVVTLYAESVGYVDSPLSPDTAYTYQVIASNVSGSSDVSPSAEATTPPAAPGSFSVTPISSTKIALGLDPNTEGLEVQRSSDGVSGWTTFTLTELSGEAPGQYGSAGLSPGTTYYFRARKVMEEHTTEFSPVVSGGTLPLAASYLYEPWLESYDSSVSLYWDHWLAEEDGFRIEFSNDGQTFQTLAETGVDETWHYEPGLEPDTHYFVRVVTVAGQVESAPSNVVDFWTAPASPTGLSAIAANATEINLTWEDTSQIETGFLIEWWSNDDPYPYGSMFAGPNTSGYSVTGLADARTYQFTVRAVADAYITSVASNEASATTDAFVEHEVGLFNTGVDGDGQSLPGGAVDQHYSGRYVINSPHWRWVPNSATSKWIAPVPDPNPSFPEGLYTYETTFSIPTGSQLASLAIVGEWAVDNQSLQGIYLNGLPTGNVITDPEGFGAFTPFTISNGLQIGDNTLLFYVANASGGEQNPTGLRVDGLRLISMPATTVSIAVGELADGDATDDGDAIASESPHTGPIPEAGLPDTATFTVSRDGDTSSPLIVQLHSPAGTAISGTDYNGFSNSVTIPAGQSSVEIVLTALADNLVEGDETVRLILKASNTYRLGNVSADGLVKDGGIFDLDVDSDNDNGLAAPARTPAEDEIEDIADVPTKPGKITPTNRADGDGDKIPGYADGFNLDASLSSIPDDTKDNQDSGARMVPVVLSIPAGTNVNSATLTLSYDASDPAAVTVEGADPYTYVLPEDGAMRLWTGTGNRVLDALSSRQVDSNGTITDTRHFYVPPSASGGYDWSTLQKLGFTKDTNGVIQNNTITLYAEGVSESTMPGEVRIEAGLTLSGASAMSDAVRLMFTEFDLDIDSFSRNADGPERTDEEEAAEDDLESRGKLVLVNDGDADNDGIVDLADGFNRDPSVSSDDESGSRFVPMILQVPGLVDPSATVTFTYSASSPLNVATGEGWAKPGAGNLRLWSQDGTATRHPQSLAAIPAADARLDDEGFFIPSATTIPLSQLRPNSDGTFTLYVEAVNSSNVTDTIHVSFSGNDFTFTDQVRLTAVQPVAPFYGDDAAMPGGVAPNADGGDSASGDFVGAMRVHDGAQFVPQTDLVTTGFDTPWGMTRTFSTATANAWGNVVGKGWVVSEMPRLVEGTSGVMLIAGGRNTRYFDRTDTGFKARFFAGETLADSNGDLLYTDTAGNQWTFNGFGPAMGELAGQPKSFKSAAGKTTTFTYNGQNQLTTITRDGGDSFAYEYVPGDIEDEPNAGLLQTVTWTRSGTAVRSIHYEYYKTEDGHAFGKDRQLKSVIVKNSTNQALEQFHYRYAGDTLAFAVEPAQFRRWAASSGATLGASTVATWANIGSFATYAFAGGTQTIAGDGAYGSPTSLAAGATNIADANVNGFGHGIHAWTTAKTISHPNGLQEKVYFNAAGMVMGREQTDPSAPNDTKTRRFWYELDDAGRVVAVAGPVATKSLTVSEPTLRDATSVSTNDGLVNYAKYNTNGYLESTAVRRGYAAEGAGATAVVSYLYEQISGQFYMPEFVTEHASDTEDRTTTYQYLKSDAHITQVTEVLPSTEGQNRLANGVAGSNQRITTFDVFGRVASETDATGAVTSYQYHPTKGTMTDMVLSGVGVNQTTTWDNFDLIGRPQLMINPRGGVTVYEYLETGDELKLITTPPVGPKTRVTHDLASGLVTTEALNRSTNAVASKSVDHLDVAGNVVSNDQYHSLTGTNQFFTTKFESDPAARTTTTTDSTSTIQKTLYNGFGEPIEERTGVAIGSLTLTTSYSYDPSGNLESVTLIPGGNEAPRKTVYSYDWRNRLIASDNGIQLVYDEPNNIGEAVTTTLYAANESPAIADNDGDGIPDRPASSENKIRAYARNDYDHRGRVFQTTQYWVDQTNGVVSRAAAESGPSLKTNVYYDDEDRVLKTSFPGGLVTTGTYDGAGRQIFATQWAGSTKLTETKTDYDANGNPVFVSTFEHSDVGPDRTSFVANYFDAGDRLTQSVNHGLRVPGFTRPTAPDARSDTSLRRDYEYDASTGRLYQVTDTLGVVTRYTEYDAMDRVREQIEGFGTIRPKKTTYGYNNAGLLETATVTNVKPNGTSQNQVTTYGYGSSASNGSTIETNNLLVSIRLDNVVTESYRYNALAEVIVKNERGGTKHAYTHNDVGQVVADEVTAFGTGIDRSTKALYTRYDTMGRPYQFTSVGTGKSDGSGSSKILNDVKRAFDGFGALTDEWQAIDTWVVTSGANESYRVQYVYEPTTIQGNRHRLQKVVTPSGFATWYRYGGANSTNDSIGRVDSIALSQAGTSIESYSYLGLGRVVGKERSQANQTMSLGLDSFARPIDVTWNAGTQPIDHFTYGYDRNSNLLWRENEQAKADGHPEFGEQYGRDTQGAQTSYLRGQLNASHAVTSPTLPYPTAILDSVVSVNWELDSMGNRYSGYYSDDYNVLNQNVQGSYGDDGYLNNAFVSPVSTLGLRYDAWGRLVDAKGPGQPARTHNAFEYDALGRRIKTDIGAGDDQINAAPVRSLYSGDNAIEDRTLSGATLAQYVWSPADGLLVLRDRNADNNASTGFAQGENPTAGMEERVYHVQDADGNTTSITDAFGSLVLERYIYSADGRPRALQGDWSNYFGVPEDTGHAEPRYRNEQLSRWATVYLYHSTRWVPIEPALNTYTGKPVGLYDMGGGRWYNAHDGRMLTPDPAAAALAAHNAYDPVPLWLKGSIVGLQASLFAVRTGSYFIPGIGLIAGTFANAFAGGMERGLAGQSAGQIIGGGLADGTGLSGIYGGVFNQDIATGSNLNLGTGARWFNGITGGVQLMAVGRIGLQLTGRSAAFALSGRGAIGSGAASILNVSVPRTAAVQAEGFIGPTIGRSGYRTMAEFRDAVVARYQRFYDMAYSRVQARVASGTIPGDAMTVGARTDRIARAAMRQWLLRSEGIQEGSGRIIQVNRWLRDPAGSGAYRIPDVRIPGARLSIDGTIGWKSSATPQIANFRGFSGGDNVLIVRPIQLGGSYGIFFP